MTADEFEASTAARSGISVERLRQLGRIVRPCFCPPDAHVAFCHGWQSTTPGWYADAIQDTPGLKVFERDGTLPEAVVKNWDVPT